MTTNITRKNEWQGTKQQEQALSRAIRTLLPESSQMAAGHEVVHTVRVEGTEYGTAWISINSEIPTLPAGNALRLVTMMDSWFVSIGKRGALEAYGYPRYAEEFKGKRFCGISIK